MKRINKITSALLLAQSSISLSTDVTSHTFFTVRPQWSSDMPEKISFFHNKLFLDYGSSFEIGFFGSKSTDPKKLARYFLPFGDTCLRIAEAGQTGGYASLNPEQLKENVIAQNINIATKNQDFYSVVTFNPHQTVYGIGLDYKQRLGKKFWLEVSAPIERVHNTMGFKEKVINDGGGILIDTNTNLPQIGLDNSPVVANATQAFTQSSWNYGRFCEQTPRWGVADIEFKIGLISLNDENLRASSYAGILFPTGNKPKGHVVFEQIVGNNQHFGFMFGQNIGIDFGCRYGFDFSLELDLNSTYLFTNTQTRSIDPFDKSFGRYLALYASEQQATQASDTANAYSGTSGINLFTRRVEVSPRGFIDINSALVFERGCFATELGFNIWARQAEGIKLKNCLTDGIAVKDIAGQGVTNKMRTINGIIQNTEAFSTEEYAANTLFSRDLNVESAAHPATIANILYASIGYKGPHTFFNIGGSYEHGHINTTLRRWLGWGKIGLTF